MIKSIMTFFGWLFQTNRYFYEQERKDIEANNKQFHERNKDFELKCFECFSDMIIYTHDRKEFEKNLDPCDVYTVECLFCGSSHKHRAKYKQTVVTYFYDLYVKKYKELIEKENELSEEYLSNLRKISILKRKNIDLAFKSKIALVRQQKVL